MAIESVEAQNILEDLREVCARYPEVSERPSHHTPTFFIRDKKVLCSLWEGSHKSSGGDDGAVALWCAAPVGVQAELVDREPERFFVPPYVGHRGWIGLRLDIDLDWDEVDAILRDAYRMIAPKKLIKELDGP